MKRTRKINIQDKIFTIDDLKRVAKIFDKQRILSEKSDHHARTHFMVRFSDNNSIEGDSSEILNEDVLRGSSRPVDVIFSFYNYKLERGLSFSVSHGDTSYGNIAEISGIEDKWVNDNYMCLKEAIDTVRPQSFWFRRHRTLGLHLIALGLGSLVQFCMDIFLNWFLFFSGFSSLIKPLPTDSSWRAIFLKALPMFYLLRWFLRWVIGMTWAFQIRSWFLRLWPNIELDFGSEHLKLEKLQRRRLIAVISLIVIPILTALIYDFLKFVF